MRNPLGHVDIDATLQVNGRFEQPRISGTLTIAASSTLRVDEILARTLLQPYATALTPSIADTDPLVALNPWDRLGLDVELHVPGTLRLQGENVQVSSGTPIGLGDINLTVTGDLYLYRIRRSRSSSPDRSTPSAGPMRFRAGGSTSRRTARSISAATSIRRCT